MTELDESLKVRLPADLKRELVAAAERADRPVGNLVRRYVREGLAADRNRTGHSRRV